MDRVSLPTVHASDPGSAAEILPFVCRFQTHRRSHLDPILSNEKCSVPSRIHTTQNQIPSQIGYTSRNPPRPGIGSGCGGGANFQTRNGLIQIKRVLLGTGLKSILNRKQGDLVSTLIVSSKKPVGYQNGHLLTHPSNPQTPNAAI